MDEFESKIQPKMYCLVVGKGSWGKRRTWKGTVLENFNSKYLI